MGTYGRVVGFWAASLVALGLLLHNSFGRSPRPSGPPRGASVRTAEADPARPPGQSRPVAGDAPDDGLAAGPAAAPRAGQGEGGPYRFADTVRRGPVLDRANLLSPAQAREVVAELRRVAGCTGVQFAVWTVPDVGDETLTELSLRQAEKLRLGQPNKDDGLLLSVSPGAREARLEVGYGLEGVLPDATSAQILRASFAGAGRAGVDGAQVIAAVVAVRTRLEQAVADGALAPPERRPDRPAEDAAFPPWPLVVVALLALWLWPRGGGPGGGRRGRGLGPLPWTLVSGALNNLGSGGQGGGGGGRGSGTQGGGGSFGGGGASSRW